MLTEKLPKISSIRNTSVYLNAMVYSLNRAMKGRELNHFDEQKLKDLSELLSKIESIDDLTTNSKNLASDLSKRAKNYEYYNLKKLIIKSYTFKSWRNGISDNDKLNEFIKSTKEIIDNSTSSGKKSQQYDTNIINNIFYDVIARY